MFKSALLPFSVTCLLYALLGFSGTGNTGTADLYALFPQNFDLHWTATIPALLIIILSLCRVKVRLTMAASIITGSLLCLFLQDITPAQLGSIMFYGFYPADQQLAQILSGGGIISMFTVSVIIILSSAYAGIFEATGFLKYYAGPPCTAWRKNNAVRQHFADSHHHKYGNLQPDPQQHPHLSAAQGQR